MNGTQFIQKGTEKARAAVDADNSGEFPAAFQLYQQALSYFSAGLKYTNHDRSRTAIRTQMEQYLKRAEEIKKLLDHQNEPKKLVAEGGGDAKGDAESKKLQDSLSSAIVRSSPNVKWSDVAGLETAKSLLKEAVIFPIRFPQLFTGKRRPWQGILLYGPPGTGKSFIAKAVATEAGSSCFLSVSSSDLVSKFQGESERLVRELFQIARANSPSIIFIDEVDSLCGARDDSGGGGASRRIITEFLVQMQGVGQNNQGVLVLGATNTPWVLDSAIRRRFEKRVYIPLPELAARIRLLEIEIGTTPHSLQKRDFRRLARRLEGFSGSDISVLVRDALYEPVRTCQTATHFRQVRNAEGKQFFEPCQPHEGKAMTIMDIDPSMMAPPVVTYDHFVKACLTAKPSVGPDDLTQLEEWTTQFGQEG
jgi:vacuolar protein-sorting-associated protein 4